VELAWQVTDPLQRQRVVDESLVAYLQDDIDAWDMAPDGTYTRLKAQGRRRANGAQAALMARYGGVGGP